MDSSRVTLQQAELDLEKATEHFRTVEAAESDARNRTTLALNALNKAQKVFDDLVKEKRSSAPNRSDWRSVRGEPL